jgi:hypothetical protein
MEIKDGKRFELLMQGMADNFRDTISEAGIKMRWELLKVYTIEKVEKAGLKIMRERKYTKMPPVAEFIEAIEGGNIPLEMVAEEQWTNVMLGLGNYSQMPEVQSDGSLKHPPNPAEKIKDPITKHLAMRRFTPEKMGACLTKELPFLRREFIAAYCSEDLTNVQKQLDYDKQSEGVKKLTGGIFKDI